MPTDKILLKQFLELNLHLGHFLTWERPLKTSSGISPRYPPASSSQLTISSHYRHNTMSNYVFFSKDSCQWGETFQSIWRCTDICPLLNQFHVTAITYLELSSLTSQKAWAMWRSSAVTLPTYWCQLKWGQQGTGCMAFPQYG